jgi:hypothetical protein
MEKDIVTLAIEDGSVLIFEKKIGVKYQPKGGMCASCAKAHDDCSGFDFSAMKVIDFCSGGKIKIVRCNHFVRP